MSIWMFRGLRDGVVTTKWPRRPDEYADTWRGPATVRRIHDASSATGIPSPSGTGVPLGADSPNPDMSGTSYPTYPEISGSGAKLERGAELERLCPTGAIQAGATQASEIPVGGTQAGGVLAGGARADGGVRGGDVRIDQGRCILCGRCVAARPDLFAWSAGATGPGAAVLARQALIVLSATVAGDDGDSDEAVAAARAALARRTAALRRSVHVRHVDAGSDGSTEWEIQALLGPVYDIHRLGIFFTASPRHADVLLVTGAGTPGMAGPLRETYDGMPDPKVVIAVGTDAISGSLLGGRLTGVAGTLPVDVWVTGDPPGPFGILKALLIATGKLS